MTLNKTKIEWCDYTWNPVTGCRGGCPYCYARKIAERFRGTKAWPNGFDPTFHSERLSDPQKTKSPSSIFVCSMADLFGDWVSDEWITSVFDACLAAPQHTYLFLTKNPQKYLTIPGIYIRKNHWFGTTVTNQYSAGQRIHWLERLPSANTFISYEPLLDRVIPPAFRGINQVIIGAQTNPTIIPKNSWIAEIDDTAARTGTRVFCKNSLQSIPDCLFEQSLCWTVNKPHSLTPLD